MTQLSIAIVNWNTRDYLDQCIASIVRTAPSVSHDIVVVDNASTDDSADMVEAKYPQVQVVRNKVNLGFASGCNIAYKHSDSQYFLLLNTDTVVLGSAIDTMVGFMQANRDAGAVGCRLLNPDGTLQRSCSCFPSATTELMDALYLSKLFPRSRLFGRYAMTYWDFDNVREVDFAGGSCLLVRRDAVSDAGLLDEGYFMFTEEADWCLRLWQHGWKVYFTPEARVIHFGGESTKRYGGDILMQLYISRHRFILRHTGEWSAGLFRLAVLLGSIPRFLAYRLLNMLEGQSGLPAGRAAFQLRLLLWAVRGPFDCRPPCRTESTV